MNRSRLKLAEQTFFDRYPDGFDSPEMAGIKKKHRIGRMVEKTRQELAPERFENTGAVLESFRKIITSSSLVSVFEKTRFRDLLGGLTPDERDALAGGLYLSLHGNQRDGFEQMINVLLPYKQAKWPILTVCLFYNDPENEVFIKPTTVKNVISYFELEGLTYSPRASHGFYRLYRDRFLEMKKAADSRLQVDNAAFSGFLFMSVSG